MPIALTTAELTSMRAAIAELLPDTCTILTVTRTIDGQGGWSDSWAASGTTTCRLDNLTKTEVLEGGAIQHYTGWVLTVPHNVTVTEENRVRVSGNDYNVRGIDSGKSWPACLRLRVEAV
ncbi:MAG: head-tail adaptor protein [Desulfurellales bacterium]|nr:MAG: head-tail adaptor protein [Desulfurellales bacterium]